MEERGQVPVLVELVLATPHPDRHDASDPTEAATPPSGRDPHLVRDLQAHIDLEEEAEGTKVVPREAVRVDLRHLAETSEGLLDFVLKPVLVREVHHMHVSEPMGHPVETVGTLI